MTHIGIQVRNLELLVTVPLLGAALGTFAAAPLMTRYGRKATMLLAYSLLCTPGSFLQLFAPNLAAMVCGRFWNCMYLVTQPYITRNLSSE